jgi:hypothetical protein
MTRSRGAASREPALSWLPFHVLKFGGYIHGIVAVI